MNVRYLKADNLACLLLPKNAILLPWRRQPKVLFAYTFNEWLAFASQQKGGQFMEYRKILQLPVDRQLQYFYADACMSQFYELAYSGQYATNVLATDIIYSEAKISEFLKQYDLSEAQKIADVVSMASPIRKEISVPSALSTLCMVYCYNMSMKGEADIWKLK